MVLSVHLGCALAFPSNAYKHLKTFFDGNVGVDLFFVISGYVITLSVSRSFFNTRSKKNALFAFWIKRAFRLLPAAFFWVFVVFLYQWFQGFYGSLGDLHLRNFIPMGSALANVNNYYAAYCTANPSDAFWCNILYYYGHYWSLSLEQQFYIVLPILFLLFKKRPLIVIMIFLIVIQFFWQRPYWTYGWFFRIDGFCWGILIALLPSKKIRFSRIDGILNNGAVTPFISYTLILMLPFWSARLQGFGSDTAIYSIGFLAFVSAIIVLLAASYENSLGSVRLYRKVMLYIGSRSYSIYIIHLITFFIIAETWAKYFPNMEFSAFEKRISNVFIILLAFVTVFALSELNYRFIEVPMRIQGKNLAKKFFIPKMMNM